MSREREGVIELPDAVHSPDVSAPPSPEDLSPLAIDTKLVERWLVEFLRSEIQRRPPSLPNVEPGKP